MRIRFFFFFFLRGPPYEPPDEPPEEPYPLLPPEPDDAPERVYPYSELPEVPRLLEPELGLPDAPEAADGRS